MCKNINVHKLYYELRIKTGALHDARHLMRPVVMVTWWLGLPCQLRLPRFVLTLDDILLGDCPNGDNFAISSTITQQRPLNTQSIIIESVILSFSIRILNNTVYAVIFEGCKFCGFCCKLVKREILILEKKQWLKETLYST